MGYFDFLRMRTSGETDEVRPDRSNPDCLALGSVEVVLLNSMLAVRQSVVLSAVMCLSGCSRMGVGSSSAELFKLRAECANQARQFEADWRRKNGTDFEVLRFQNHYNQTHGRCFVHIYYGNPYYSWEEVYDAVEDVSQPPIVFLVRGSDKAANESKENRDLSARIRDYMEGMEKSK